MDQLPVIPTPPGQKWREFRIRYLPLLVFFCTVGSISYIWREHVTPPTLVAHVEPVLAYVRTSGDCIVTNLLVEAYQPVRKGETIAEVIITDTRRFDAHFQMLRSQLSLVQLELGTIVDRDRLALDYFNLRTDFQDQIRTLKEAQAELPFAEYNVNLSSNLVGNGLVTQFDHQGYLQRMAVLKADIEVLSKTVADLEQTLDSLKFAAQGNTNSNARSLGNVLADLEQQRIALETMATTPVALPSPMDGVVSFIHARPGESVMGGEPVVTISASESTRIVGYLRQPLALQPQSGMPCEIRTRSWKRLQSEAVILAVGAQFETITNISLLRPDQMPEIGLPIAISIPESLRDHLRPGEVVDVTVRTR
ncbi:MAG: HlyD family secretion protein [Limisphaerales bacterium]